MRDSLGLDPYANAAADRPMVLTPTGYMPIEANSGGQGVSPTEGAAPSTDAQTVPAVAKAPFVKNYDPDQPRVPAGKPDAGQWTSEGGSGSTSDSTSRSGTTVEGTSNPGTQYAALDTGTRTDATDGGGASSSDSNAGSNGSAATNSNNNGVVVAGDTVTPRGFTVRQVPGQDPLDPRGLNTPISADEQQKIADALTLVVNRNVSTLNPHPYDNYPHQITGAVLPPSVQGYTTYDVLGFGTGRGVNRLVVDNGTGAIYYTNTHYYSFYPVQLQQPRN